MGSIFGDTSRWFVDSRPVRAPSRSEMEVCFVAFGSIGDALPLIALAAELVSRGGVAHVLLSARAASVANKVKDWRTV